MNRQQLDGYAASHAACIGVLFHRRADANPTGINRHDCPDGNPFDVAIENVES